MTMLSDRPDVDPPGHIGCTVPGCIQPVRARRMCSNHWKRWRRHGDPLAGRSPDIRVELEDVEWMAETGETATGAAQRLGAAPRSLQRHLERAGRADLWSVMSRRERMPN